MNPRPKVSVCVASYQGERYINEQLQSIFAQLSESDEVIVVDDGSTDNTCSVISSQQDNRLIFLRKDKNQGVLRAFEAALSRASGQIIFLSDQDDIWIPEKVETVLDAFSRDPELCLVASDAILIDENGEKIGNSFYAQRGRFTSGLWSNILIGKFHGCTMAFRSKLLEMALPFPFGNQVHHDTWIGCVNALIGGKAEYIDQPLVAYRRHATNVTGRIRLGNVTRFIVRFQLVLGLLLFCFNRPRLVSRVLLRGSSA